MPLNLMLVWGPPTPAGADPGIEPGLLEGGGCGSFFTQGRILLKSVSFSKSEQNARRITDRLRNGCFN